MTRLALIVLALAVLVSPTLSAQDPARLLKAAMNTEMVDGDPKAAIEQYKKVVAADDRALAAQALLRMAGCYQKLGDAEAQKIYAQILRDFADQTVVVAEARTRVGLNDPARGRTDSDGTRTVWTIPDDPSVRILGPVSADGRYLPLVRASGEADLVVRDLIDGSDRLVPRSPADDGLRADGSFRVGDSVLSRDGRKLASRLAVSRLDGGLKFTQLRVWDLSGDPRSPRIRTLLDGADVVPYDWSPNGMWIAIRRRKDPTHQEIGLVSVEDGSIRILKTLDWRSDRSYAGWLSPDGRQLAIEVPTNAAGSRDIMILAVDGGPDVHAVEWTGDDILLGWSPDGMSLLFSSARGSGTLDIWRQQLEAGHPKGGPDLVRRGAPVKPLGLTSAGALYSVDNAEGPARCRTAPACGVKEAAFDFETGGFISAPRDVSAAFVRSNEAPRWSPDGTRLGYFANRGDRDEVLIVKNVRTGESREVRLDFLFRGGGNMHRWDWMPDGESIVAQGQDVDRAGDELALHRIDLTTGKVSPILPHLGVTWFRYISWSADGKALYYHRESTAPPLPGQPFRQVRMAHDLASGTEAELFPDSPFARWHGPKVYYPRRVSGGVTIVERDTESGTERELLPIYGASTEFRLTADGRSILAVTTDLSTAEPLVVLCSIADGSVTTAFRGERGRMAKVELLARDERSAIVSSATREGAAVYWWVPFDGRASRQLEELAGVNLIALGARTMTMELNPDGRRLAFGVAYPRTTPDRIRVLENLLPSVKR